MTEDLFANDWATLVERTGEIVSAYIRHHVVPVTDLPRLIIDVYRALQNAAEPVLEVSAPEKQKPAVTVRKSIHQDHLVCLECGLSFKSLKRHLMKHHSISPDEYRVKWDLPNDYPMVAPSYSDARSLLAKGMGLGQGARRGRRH